MKQDVPDEVELIMVRDDLEGLPWHPLPPSFGFRWHLAGDEATWVRLQAPFYELGAVTLDLFREQFGQDPDVQSQRICYLLDPAGDPVGTAAAWLYDGFRGPEYGRIHWVAIAEAYQRRGLSKPLLARVCWRLRELGHTKAYLTTSPGRPVAIALYRYFGFVPL